MPGWYSSLLSSLYHNSNALVNNNNNTAEQEVLKAEEEADQAAKLGHPGTQSQLRNMIQIVLIKLNNVPSENRFAPVFLRYFQSPSVSFYLPKLSIKFMIMDGSLNN